MRIISQVLTRCLLCKAFDVNCWRFWLGSSSSIMKQLSVSIDWAIVGLAVDCRRWNDCGFHYNSDNFSIMMMGSGIFFELEINFIVFVGPLGRNPDAMRVFWFPIIAKSVGFSDHLFEFSPIDRDDQFYLIVVFNVVANVVTLIEVNLSLLVWDCRLMRICNNQEY